MSTSVYGMKAMHAPADLSAPAPADGRQIAPSPEQGRPPESPIAEGAGSEPFGQMIAQQLARVGETSGETSGESAERQEGLAEALALASVLDPGAQDGNALPPATLASLPPPVAQGDVLTGDGSEEPLPGLKMRGIERALGASGMGAVDLALTKGMVTLAEQTAAGIANDSRGSAAAAVSAQAVPPPAGLAPGPVQATAPLAHTAPAMLPGLDRPLGDPGWGQQLGDRIQWMVSRDVQAAQLRIHPRHLGPIELRVTVQQDQASVTLVSQHAAVREAMEAVLPRLRDMLVEQGMQHVDVNVSQHSFAEQRERRERDGEKGEPSSVNEGTTSGPGGAEGERVLTAGVPRAVDLYV